MSSAESCLQGACCIPPDLKIVLGPYELGWAQDALTPPERLQQKYVRALASGSSNFTHIVIAELISSLRPTRTLRPLLVGRRAKALLTPPRHIRPSLDALAKQSREGLSSAMSLLYLRSLSVSVAQLSNSSARIRVGLLKVATKNSNALSAFIRLCYEPVLWSAWN